MLEPNKIEIIIGNRIRNYRKRLGYSQDMLAEKADLYPAYIGQIERGEKRASLHSILKIANALEMPLEILFENIILNESHVDTISSQCYELIDGLSAKEQKAMLKLIKDIIKYKEL
ncbi:helix-turn-helix domain-containing protein [Clostridioides sp. ES-S-0048-02]|uniref:helix-turn-helix domain-containing protein n=1 Tax=Clostridioides sp. ES-S-0048-02 TaxID=2770777 RepID=UPI001D1078F8|nr:helix-turn-helix transcriptional regulator [Clostridioides sp. ES-S-0048-02]